MPRLYFCSLLLFGIIVVSLSLQFDKSPAKVFISSTRAENNEDNLLKVIIETRGRIKSLNLIPVRQSIWSKNAQFISLTTDESGNPTFEHIPIEKNHKVFQDTEAGAILGIDDGKINGILGDSLTIKNVDNEHYVYRSNEYVDFINDYLEIPDAFADIEIIKMNKRHEGHYTIELLVVVDSVLAKEFDSDQDIYNYLTIFWNSVNQRYLSISDPQFTAVLVGVIIIKDTSSESFAINNLYQENNDILISNSIYDFSEWISQNLEKGSLPFFDMTYLQTGRNLAFADGNMALAGLAWVAGACPGIGKNGSYYATGVGQDMTAFFDGVFTAAHEVAHNVGSPHDGSIKYGTDDCPWSDGYIMSYIAGSINRVFFSPCSIDKMKSFAESPKGACLSKADNEKPMPVNSNFLPGHVMDLHETCQQKLNDPKAEAHDLSNCYQLKCRKPIKDEELDGEDDANDNDNADDDENEIDGNYLVDNYDVVYGSDNDEDTDDNDEKKKYKVWLYSVPPPEGVKCKNNGGDGRCHHGVCDITAVMPNSENIN